MEITDSVLGFLVYGLGFILSYLTGLALFAALGMIIVRTSAKLFGLGEVPILKAFLVALAINFVCSVINFSISFNFGLSVSLMSQFNDRPIDMDDMTRLSLQMMNPTYYLWLTALLLAVAASIFQCTLRKGEEQTRLSFGESFGLASLYYAITFVALALLFFFVYAMFVLTFALIDAPATGY